MRAKRSKQYRKLMHQYELTFSFREPYQVLVDAAMVQDAHRCKLDLATALERTLHAKVKPSTLPETSSIKCRLTHLK
jgi:U3 small nucleolar RNA-associated protein 23